MYHPTPALLLAGMILTAAFQSGAQETEVFQWIPGDRVAVAYRNGDSLRGRRIGEFLRGLPALPGLSDSLPTGLSLYRPGPTQLRFPHRGGRA